MILLLPHEKFPEGNKAKVIEVLQDFIEPGDQYTFEEFDCKDVDKVNISTPMIGFDPLDKEHFVWFTPPRHLMS